MLKKKIIIGAVGVVTVGIIAAVFFFPESLSVEPAKIMDVSQTVRVTGNIEADESETIYAPVSGKIGSINFQEGDIVTSSDLIASYDLTIIENEYIKASATYEANKEGYEAAVSENSQSSSKFSTAQEAEVNNRMELEAALAMINSLDITNRGEYIQQGDYNYTLNLEIWLKELENETQLRLSDKASAESNLEVAKSNIIPYREELNLAKAAYEEAEEAFQNDPTKEQERDEALAYYNSAKNQYDEAAKLVTDAEDTVKEKTNKVNKNKEEISSALSQLNDIKKKNYSNHMSDEEYAQYVTLESRIKLLEQDLAKNLSDRQYNESKLINEHTLKQYQSNMNIAEADANTASHTFALAKEGIKSNKTAVIIEKLVDANAMVQAGAPICTIQPTENLKVEAMVSKFDIDKIALDQEAKVIVGDKTYNGKVTKIFPVATKDDSGKPKVKIWVSLDITEDIPTIGLEAQVIIHTGVQTGVLAVPFESVYSDNDGDYVYLLDGMHAVKQYIDIDMKGNDNFSVYQGLSEGDEVIVTPFSDNKLDGLYTKE